LPSVLVSLPVFFLIALLLSGCSASPRSRDLVTELPAEWQAAINSAESLSNTQGFLDNSELQRLIAEAISNNYQLAQAREALEERRLAVIISGAERYPLVTLNLEGRRQKSVVNGNNQSILENYSGALNATWELDIWGKLSDRQKQAQLSYMAARFGYNRTQRQLTADVATAWAALMAAREQLALFDQRLINLQANLDIIESGYRRGLNAALDVYLTRNTVAEEQSRVASQHQVVFEQIVVLQRLLARYPDGQWQAFQALPAVEDMLPAGMPSELLSRRNDIQQAWASLLSADAALAVAHKERFPSLNLVASGGSASEALHSLVDEGSLAWSLLADLSQPVFAGRRLQAEEQQAASRVSQAEKAYLDILFTAMAETEQTLNNEHRLRQRYQALLQAEQNANAAYDLSFQQYRRGLVDYATVLEAQRRAFDAQTGVIQLRNQLVSNRIALVLALGGDPFPESATASNNPQEAP
jgi:outer membrane protein, multidrug efflux system